MKKWNFKISSKPQDIRNKLEDALRSVGDIVFKNDESENNWIEFNFRKRVKYPDQILHRNRIIVNGRISNLDADNKSSLEISFSQHFFMTLTIFSMIVSGLAFLVIISKLSSGVSMFLYGAIVIIVGFLLWKAMQHKFKKDTEEYKALISKILNS